MVDTTKRKRDQIGAKLQSDLSYFYRQSTRDIYLAARQLPDINALTEIMDRLSQQGLSAVSNDELVQLAGFQQKALDKVPYHIIERFTPTIDCIKEIVPELLQDKLADFWKKYGKALEYVTSKRITMWESGKTDDLALFVREMHILHPDASFIRDAQADEADYDNYEIKLNSLKNLLQIKYKAKAFSIVPDRLYLAAKDLRNYNYPADAQTVTEAREEFQEQIAPLISIMAITPIQAAKSVVSIF